MLYFAILKRVGFFIVHFLLTKELMYKFYEDWNYYHLLTISMDDVFNYRLKISILSLICCFIFVMLNYAFRNINAFWKVLSFFISLLASLVIVNYLYSIERSEIYIRNLYNNFVVVGIMFCVFHFILNILFDKFTNRTKPVH